MRVPGISGALISPISSVPLSPVLEPLLKKFSGVATLSRPEIGKMQAPEFRRRIFDRGSRLVSLSACNRSLPLLLSGWACHQRNFGDGRRQIVDLLLPGDTYAVLDWPSYIAPVTLTAVEAVEFVCRKDTDDALVLHENQVTFAHQEKQKRLHNHLMRLGRLTAKERMAHLLLELLQRLAEVGLARDRRFQCPLTQEIIGDFLGLSAVHVNRILQCCRRERLVRFTCGYVEILQPQRLAQLGQCDLATMPKEQAWA